MNEFERVKRLTALFCLCPEVLDECGGVAGQNFFVGLIKDKIKRDYRQNSSAALAHGSALFLPHCHSIHFNSHFLDLNIEWMKFIKTYY